MHDDLFINRLYSSHVITTTVNDKTSTYLHVISN